MAKKEPVHPLYTAFIAVMVLLIVIGVILMIYGSLHNGVPVPTLPGNLLTAPAARLYHG